MSQLEPQMIRLLHGELPPERARELRRRIAADAALAASFRRLEQIWNALEAPPPPPVDAGFTARVALLARRQAAEGLNWSLAPAWARAGAVTALAAGLVLGLSLPRADEPVVAADLEGYTVAEPLSLAESYWEALEDTEATWGDATPERVQ